MPQKDIIYHRYEESVEVIQEIAVTGLLKGKAPRNIFQSHIPAVKANEGPLPAGRRGFEFTTAVPPDPGCAPGDARWRGPREGVTIEGDWAVIVCKVVRVAT